MADLYCSPADLYSFGIPRGGVPNPGRLAATVYTDRNLIELSQHGLDTGDRVSFRAEAGGTMPSPLVSGAKYYALPEDDTLFGVSATDGGVAIDITTNGTRLVVIVELQFDKAIAWASRLIDDMLPAHAVPVASPYPEILRMTCAELAAAKVLSLTGESSKTLGELVTYAQKRVERWAKGIPIRGTNSPTRTNLAIGTSIVNDSRGWGQFGGTQ